MTMWWCPHPHRLLQKRHSSGYAGPDIVHSPSQALLGEESRLAVLALEVAGGLDADIAERAIARLGRFGNLNPWSIQELQDGCLGSYVAVNDPCLPYSNNV